MKWVVLLVFLIGCTNVDYIDERNTCESDSDCVPMPGCHARECVTLDEVALYDQPEACTALFDCSAAYTSEDCLCQDHFCVNKNLDNGCSTS